MPLGLFAFGRFYDGLWGGVIKLGISYVQLSCAFSKFLGGLNRCLWGSFSAV